MHIKVNFVQSADHVGGERLGPFQSGSFVLGKTFLKLYRLNEAKWPCLAFLDKANTQTSVRAAAGD